MLTFFVFGVHEVNAWTLCRFFVYFKFVLRFCFAERRLKEETRINRILHEMKSRRWKLVNLPTRQCVTFINTWQAAWLADICFTEKSLCKNKKRKKNLRPWMTDYVTGITICATSHMFNILQKDGRKRRRRKKNWSKGRYKNHKMKCQLLSVMGEMWILLMPIMSMKWLGANFERILNSRL